MYLSVFVSFATPYVVVHNAAAGHHIHHLQAFVYSTGHTGTDDAVGVETVDKFHSSGGGVHFSYATLHQDERVLSHCSFGEVEGASLLFFLFAQELDNLFVFHAHGGNDSYFHRYKRLF